MYCCIKNVVITRYKSISFSIFFIDIKEKKSKVESKKLMLPKNFKRELSSKQKRKILNGNKIETGH